MVAQQDAASNSSAGMGTSSSPAITAMAAMAAAATLASAMAEAQKGMAPGNATQDTPGAAAVVAAGKQQGEGPSSSPQASPQASQSMAAAAAAVAAAAGVNPALVSQAMVQNAASGAVAANGLLPVGWNAQSSGHLRMAGAMLGHQLAMQKMQKWAHMAAAPIPVGVSMTGKALMPPARSTLESYRQNSCLSAHGTVS